MGVKKPPKSCVTCKWSRGWQRTKTGRIKKGTGGRCMCPVVDPILPASITRSYWYKPISQMERSYIWPATGETCPTWEAIEP